MNNIEQIEAQLQEFNERVVNLRIPIRGTVYINFYGTLKITNQWENNKDGFIHYTVKCNAISNANFQSKDVFSIVKINIGSTYLPLATITIKSDDLIPQLININNTPNIDNPPTNYNKYPELNKDIFTI